MTEVPAATPCIVPEELPMVAMPPLTLIHVPPVGVPVNVVFEPTQVDPEPEIEGAGNTVTTTVGATPQPSV